METKLTSIDISHRVAEDSETHGCKPWVADIAIVLHTLGILTTNITYCMILLEYVTESQVEHVHDSPHLW